MSENRYKFSVITISLNAEKIIQRTIDSVIKQNFSDMEYIFVDGGSMDATNEIINKYEEKLCLLGIAAKHISEYDKGISEALNKGIMCAEGEIIVILNADDELIEGTMKRISEEMDNDVDIIYGNCLWIDETHKLQYVRKSKANLSKLMYQMDIMHPATFIRKKMYNRHGLYDISYKFCMDEELLVRMQRGGARFRYVDYEFSIMKAGGVSDKDVWPVILEGTRIPLQYNKSEFYVMIRARIKYVRHHLAHIVRFGIIPQKKT